MPVLNYTGNNSETGNLKAGKGKWTFSPLFRTKTFKKNSRIYFSIEV